MKVCVLGTGAYGSALASILSENKNEVIAWTAFEEEAKALKKTRIAPKLPGIVLPENINFTSNLEEACKDADFILIAIPTAFVTETLKKAKPYIKDKPICIASKGIEQNTCLFVSQIVENIIKTDNIAAISGPSFAIDVANKVPLGLTLACKNKETTKIIINAFSNNHFKLQTTDDIIGTEICGSIKNVMAIASGMLDGMKLPESTIAMFITEAAKDIKNLIEELGGSGNTILSLAGFGDLLLTCTSPKSRNYSFGQLIGKGASQTEIDEYLKNTTVEGIYTLNSIKKLITDKNINVPIINLIENIVYSNKKAEDLINYLIKNNI